MARTGKRRTSKTKEITLDDLLWKITKKYDEAIYEMKLEKERKMREAVQLFCPLPKKGEVIEADYTYKGKHFSYENFKPRYGDVILFGGAVKKNGNISEGMKPESRISGKSIKIIVPCEDE